jgi:hypothetical protein
VVGPCASGSYVHQAALSVLTEFMSFKDMKSNKNYNNHSYCT